MLDIGICGTDEEIGTFEYGTPPSGDDYLVIGHAAAPAVAAGLEYDIDAVFDELDDH
jgi:glucose 1-dehydrogenase